MRMTGGKRLLWIVTVVFLTAGPSPSATSAPINYEMVTVGNAGNTNDTTGYGGVVYDYKIGKYDVTIGQYAAFLNAVAATDTYSLYDSRMSSDGNIKGIQRHGSSGNYTYSVLGSANRPITYVSWFDAARFSNWMTNGQGSGRTETGAYTLNGETSGNAVAANADAAFRLPSGNEWYKAAYYSPALNGGAGGYYAFATQSNDPPGNIIGNGVNQVNCATGIGYAVTQVSSYDANQNYLTDVGAFSGSGSFYGTFDQNGNVYQWNDLNSAIVSDRGVRGGSWYKSNPWDFSSSNSWAVATSYKEGGIGFRLASSASGPPAVPEIDLAGMGSVLAFVTGALGLLERRRLKVA